MSKLGGPNEQKHNIPEAPDVPSAGTTTHCGIELPAATNRAEIEKVADFIHQIWQETNSYRTRYKDVKVEGQPVTDKEQYLKQFDIPVYFHDYYKLTINEKHPGGILQEDIKKIPNRVLSQGNSHENFVGAQSYIEHLGALLDAIETSPEKAQAHLLECLRNIHTDWYQRNSSWTVPYGEPSTYDASAIETKYNGTRQLFEIAKRFGALNIPEVSEAFSHLLDELKREKFAPYKDLSLEQAYAAMARKTGLRPSILGDAHVAELFEHYFRPLPFSLKGRGPETEKVAEFLRQFFPDIKNIPAEHFVIEPPSVAPGSGARVYVIVDSLTDKAIAVFKVHNGTRGLDEIVSNVAAKQEVKSSQTFKPVEWLSTGMLEGDDYFVLLDAAEEFEADAVFSMTFSDCMMMASKAADSLATLHGPIREPSAYKGGDLTTFKGNCWYDVRELIRFISPRPGEARSTFAKIDPHPESERLALYDFIRTTIDRYSDIVENKPALLCPSTVHGDMHSGNLFISDDSDQNVLIDYGGITWTIGQNFGTGDRGNDLGRFIGSIFVEGSRRNFDFETQTKVLIQRLLAEYSERVGIDLASEQGKALCVSAAFYANRFVAVNAQDTEGKKNKPIAGETLSQMRERLYRNWERLPEVFASWS